MGTIDIVLVPLLLAPLALVALCVIALIWAIRHPGPPAAGISRNKLTRPARDALLHEKRDRRAREEKRIHDLVEAGRISSDEAKELLGVLHRETDYRSCPLCSEEIRTEALKCPHCREFLVEDLRRKRRRLVRSRERILCGVCGGLAEFVGMDPSLLRVLAVVGTLLSGGMAGVVFYLVAAVIMPEE